MTDLQQLRDKVAAGEVRREDLILCDKHGIPVNEFHKALLGSVDAALALVGELLPGWTVANLSQQDNKNEWWAELRKGHLTSYSGVIIKGDVSPARALLLALLDALKGKVL